MRWICDLAGAAVFVAVAVLLWLMPRSRKGTGNWLVAWKVVPFGCLTEVLLLTGVPFLIGKMFPSAKAPFWFPPAMFHVALVVAWLVIVFGVRWVRRRFAAANECRWFPAIAVFAICGVVSTVVSIMIFISNFDFVNYRGEWRKCDFADEGVTKVSFERRSIHPFMAEYEYRLRFARDGRESTVPLMLNSGGRTYFNIYRVCNGRFFLTDKSYDYLVDPAAMEVRYLDMFEGKLYAAPLPDIPEGAIRSWSGPHRKNTSIVMSFNDREAEAENVSGVLDKLAYYGCIDTDFHSAAERAERRIERTFRPALPRGIAENN